MSKVSLKKSVSREGKENQINMKENVMYVLLLIHKITLTLYHHHHLWIFDKSSLHLEQERTSEISTSRLDFVLFVFITHSLS